MTLLDARIADPDSISFSFPCIRIQQPVGHLYMAALPFKILCAISDFDVRHVLQEDRDIDRYLGIQRPLNTARVKEIEQYVNFADASFPSAIIIAVDERCASYDMKGATMTLSNVRDPENPVLVRHIARVIDGQHRIAGLYQCRQERFDCPVTILLGMDLSDQAQMFARVNLSQTPVNPSLVYDLFELSKTRSPQKTCHDVTVRLDRAPTGPFFRRIKRLGTATPGRDDEFLTQATVVRGIMQHITSFPDRDRDTYLRGNEPPKPDQRERRAFIFREWFLESREDDIFREVTALFEAVRERWPVAWASNGEGYMLGRASGYSALMRFLRDSTIYWGGAGSTVTSAKHLRLLKDVRLNDDDLTTVMFPPGSSGEAKLYTILKAAVPN